MEKMQIPPDRIGAAISPHDGFWQAASTGIELSAKIRRHQPRSWGRKQNILMMNFGTY
jgi:hypothetical protein